MENEKCGVYQIQCSVSGKVYIGSSKHVFNRWYQHRSALRRGQHTGPRLQKAWNKHGESKFVFSVLEECSPDDRYQREQFWIDQKKPDYNSMPVVTVITEEMRRKMLIGIQNNRFSLATHCPKGHPYNDLNTFWMKSKKGRQCRECARIRTRKALELETPQQREIRRQRVKQYYQRTRETQREQRKLYAESHKLEKQAYDRAYRARRMANDHINEGY